jgi:hypothetical protein
VILRGGSGPFQTLFQGAWYDLGVGDEPLKLHAFLAMNGKVKEVMAEHHL